MRLKHQDSDLIVTTSDPDLYLSQGWGIVTDPEPEVPRIAPDDADNEEKES